MAQRTINGVTYQEVLLPGDNAVQAGVIRGRAYTPSIAFNRPNDTNNYTAGDVIGSATTANHEMPLAGAAGSLIQIISASVLLDRTSVPTGMTTLRLHLWDSQPTAIADNAAFAAASADRSRYRGWIDLPAVSVVGGGFVFSFADYVGRPFRLTTTSLWCNLVTIAGVTTPAALTEYTIRMNVVELGA